MPFEKNRWTIEIRNFNGFVPAWFENTYPFFGNKEHASDMINADLTDPNTLKPGPGVANLTNGTQAGAVTTLIRGILKTPVSSNVSYACGGAKYYQLSATTVTNTGGTYPHTIDKATVTGEDAEDVVYHKSIVYVFYNHSGSAGDIMKDNAGTIDDDWGSTVPTGMGTLQYAPHQAINGGDDDCYFGNGQYVGAIRANGTLELQALDFWANSEVSSLTWNGNRVLIAINRPNLTGSNFSQSGVYTWNGVSSSWEGDPIEVSGRIGALYTKNGVTFIWWQDGTDTGGFTFGYLEGTQVKPIKRFKGSLPLYYQVGEYKGFIAWVSGGYIYLWGSKDPDEPVRFFQYIQPVYTTTVGGIGIPFGDLLMASNATTNYSLAKPSGYVITFQWKTRAFPATIGRMKSQIDIIEVETEQMATGAKCDFTLTYDKGKSSLALDQIAYSTANKTRHKILSTGVDVEDFRIDANNANGSTTNPVIIRSIIISGYYITDN